MNWSTFSVREAGTDQLVILQNVRAPEELAERIAAQIEGDSVSILDLMHDPGTFGIRCPPRYSFTIFIPEYL